MLAVITVDSMSAFNFSDQFFPSTWALLIIKLSVVVWYQKILFWTQTNPIWNILVRPRRWCKAIYFNNFFWFTDAMSLKTGDKGKRYYQLFVPATVYLVYYTDHLYSFFNLFSSILVKTTQLLNKFNKLWWAIKRPFPNIKWFQRGKKLFFLCGTF